MLPTNKKKFAGHWCFIIPNSLLIRLQNIKDVAITSSLQNPIQKE